MSRTILLADDSITIQKIVTLTFSSEGIDVVAVGNGDAALKKIYEVQPDVVLADIFMPGKNGYEVCEYIKNEPKLRSTPVILLVGAFEPFDSNEASRVRADGHLTKPFEIKVLISAVNSLLSEAEGQEEKKSVETSLSDSASADATEPGLPPLPAAPQAVHWEPDVEAEVVAEAEGATSPPDSGEPIPSIPLGVALEEAGFADPSVPEPEPEMERETEANPEADSEARVPAFQATSLNSLDKSTPTEPTFEESDPLGLLEGDLSFAAVEDAADVSSAGKSLIIDIWERESSTVGAVAETSPKAVLTHSEAEPVDALLEVKASRVDEMEPPADLRNAAALATAVHDPVPQMEIERPASHSEAGPLPAAAAAGEPVSLISEELMDRIANRVLEKLSRDVIEKIAWEVVPDLAELIIKEQVETHFKASRQP